ncbi:MAG TPA: ABC transporter ATP-binding protein [Holophagaceae bacterium]|nr:ABC transporter ATP-binding protein [Holophagaceae bacterium]
MPELVIESMGLCCRHGDVVAVSGLDLAVPRGSVFGFLGPNGAGKTSTIRMLLGLKAPASGTLRLLGEEVRAGAAVALGRIGSMVEHPSLYPHLTAGENLRITCRMRGLGPREVDRVLERVGLVAAADQLVRTFSLGMRQRLGLALAWVGEPELLILDEPTNGLDPAGMRDIRALLKELPRAKGTTVFLSSHLLGEVEQVASHVGVLHQGRLRFQGTLEALKAGVGHSLRIGVSEPERALALLQGAGYGATPGEEGSLQVSYLGEAQAARINALLVAAGLGVHHLAMEPSSLERIFLGLTEVA